MNLIGNEWIDASDKLEVKNPATSQPLGHVAVAGKKEVAAAVSAAQAASRTPLSRFERSRLLRSVHEQLSEKHEDAAQLVMLETGKPIRECRAEIERALLTLLWSAEEAVRQEGETLPCDITEKPRHRYAFSVRVPLGVIACITPFNFPINVSLHKIAPALAAGNSVIWKPSPKTPLSANFMGKLFIEAGMPKGLLNIIHGGADVAIRLAESNVSIVNFTGGTQAAESLAHAAAGKKLLLELGGNDPVIVAADADLAKAAEAIVLHRFGSAGQRCSACKRVFVHASRFDELVGQLKQRIEALRVGDPADEKTDVGPLITEEAAIRIEKLVEKLREAGAKILTGGKREGAVYLPTLLTGVPPTSPDLLQEVFGPVLPVHPYQSIEEVIEWVNAAPVGLQAGIFTNNLEAAHLLFEKLEVGTLVLNDGPNFRLESLPFGGLKTHSSSREGIRYAMQEMSTLKTLVW